MHLRIKKKVQPKNILSHHENLSADTMFINTAYSYRLFSYSISLIFNIATVATAPSQHNNQCTVYSADLLQNDRNLMEVTSLYMTG